MFVYWSEVKKTSRFISVKQREGALFSLAFFASAEKTPRCPEAQSVPRRGRDFAFLAKLGFGGVEVY